MQNFSASPKELVSSIWLNRSLTASMIKREVIGRYRGSIIGILWSFIHPVLMLLIYTFVFSVIFKARWGESDSSKAEFALILFAGLIIFNLFAECLNRAPGLILANANYVKKVVFPLSILPWVVLGSSIFHALISFSVWLLAYTIWLGIPHLSAFFLPLTLLPLIFLIMGLTWVLASLGVYLRDISHLISLVTTALMFLSPIFYPVSALPIEFQKLISLNPLAPVIEQTRNVLYWGQMPDITLLLLHLGFSGAFACIGFAFFQKTRKGFADVL